MNRNFKASLVHASLSVFCVIFNLIYSRFSHNVSSVYMTYMFSYTLAAAVYFLISAVLRAPRSPRLSFNLFNSGIASITLWSMLFGIFEIAGTDSPYAVIFLWAGLAMILASAAVYLCNAFKNNL
ncbi:hypothetical protein SDC9_84025 [bioreactor metagenome]|uniref:Uncharacterized protein n=1 Tax=bioreactor metagenome TaxID=1076179 RepID=A0A644ZBZ3_9ZZZZ|nr:hypothetical protein [Oscillospiraceae bacterium]